jgi:sigma-E factor negative regulatory protein RseA
MKTRISALMDGELEPHEIAPAFETLRRDPSLRVDWSTFHQIGEVLRREPRGSVDISRDFGLRVLEALESEPTVLAPLHVRRSTWQQPLLALAASLAGVAVVGWVGFGGFEQAPLDIAVLNTGVPSAANVTLVNQSGMDARPGDARSLQAYVLAHHAHGSANAFVGNTRYIRTVFGVNENR